MQEFNVFYSWQSDLPNNTNRRFIKDILDRAAKTTTTDTVDVVIDEALRDTTGSPKIDEKIIQKIRSCDMFVADISFVGQSFDELDREKPRLLPNPNVLFELGIASEVLDWERILLIANDNYGILEHLPFDLRQHNCIPYSLSPNAEDKSDTRMRLKRKIESDLRSLIGTEGKRQDRSKPCLELKWSTALKLKPFTGMYSEIDRRIAKAVEHEKSLSAVKDQLTDLQGEKVSMLNGTDQRILRRYRSYITSYINALLKLSLIHI